MAIDREIEVGIEAGRGREDGLVVLKIKDVETGDYSETVMSPQQAETMGLTLMRMGKRVANNVKEI